jgi:hypothetical protein
MLLVLEVTATRVKTLIRNHRLLNSLAVAVKARGTRTKRSTKGKPAKRIANS